MKLQREQVFFSKKKIKCRNYSPTFSPNLFDLKERRFSRDLTKPQAFQPSSFLIRKKNFKRQWNSNEFGTLHTTNRECGWFEGFSCLPEIFRWKSLLKADICTHEEEDQRWISLDESRISSQKKSGFAKVRIVIVGFCMDEWNVYMCLKCRCYSYGMLEVWSFWEFSLIFVWFFVCSYCECLLVCMCVCVCVKNLLHRNNFVQVKSICIGWALLFQRENASVLGSMLMANIKSICAIYLRFSCAYHRNSSHHCTALSQSKCAYSSVHSHRSYWKLKCFNTSFVMVSLLIFIRCEDV